MSLPPGVVVFLLYETFNLNLFGIKDDVVNAFNAISNAVTDGIKTYQDMISFGFNPFEAAFFGIGSALDSIGLGVIGGFFTKMAQSSELPPTNSRTDSRLDSRRCKARSGTSCRRWETRSPALRIRAFGRSRCRTRVCLRH